MVYVVNSFSLGMLSHPQATLQVRELGLEEARSLIQGGFVSAVGHQATAEILSTLLGANVPYNRVQVKLERGDKVLVFQLLTRLEEGRVLTREEISSLPFKFYLVDLKG
ncbi:MAG: DUF1874 domain-containing protein [Desulfurococcaceae archaeon]